MGKPVITSLKEMRAIASMELGERFNIDWEIDFPILSEKDKKQPRIRELDL